MAGQACQYKDEHQPEAADHGGHEAHRQVHGILQRRGSGAQAEQGYEPDLHRFPHRALAVPCQSQ